ncbi:uncharacterized protein LOC135481841 isoform X1 [Liolophura sinensis]|uniref:uncharacterized protein LOC135481841 isoform X1 n=1 Tax=Liolophura sinensis TaxID=3198878 RepID=UPI003158AF1F
MSEMLRQVDNLRDIRKTKKSNAAQAALNNASRQSGDKPINTATAQNSAHVPLQAGASAMPSGAAANAEMLSNNAVGGASGGQGATGGADVRPKIKNKNQTFGGFQKGFLFNATASSGKHDKRTNETRNLTESNAAGAKKTYNKDMPFIKPKQTNREKGLEIPEVQQAMLASEGLLQNKEWLTDDLLSQIQGNDLLARRLTDPVFVQAIGEFQSDPQGAMLKYQNNSEIQKFFKDFCGIIGDHFTKLGNKQDLEKPSAKAREVDSAGVNVLNSNINSAMAPADEDERRMQEILANPEIRQILIDPDIQRLVQTLRSNQVQAQSILHSADPEMRRKIKKLIDAGLLVFQT